MAKKQPAHGYYPDHKMKPLYPNDLEAAVAARNEVNQEANELSAILIEAFRPWIGKKILKADHTLLAKCAALVPERPLHHWHSISQYALYFAVRSSTQAKRENDPTMPRTVYSEVCFSVGSIEDGILKDVQSRPCNYRTDYTSAEILAARKEVAAAERALDEAKSKLEGFGER